MHGRLSRHRVLLIDLSTGRLLHTALRRSRVRHGANDGFLLFACATDGAHGPVLFLGSIGSHRTASGDFDVKDAVALERLVKLPDNELPTRIVSLLELTSMLQPT